MMEESSAIERANRIVNALLEHLEEENCPCCKSILKEVFE